MEDKAVIQAIDRQEWLEPVADRMQATVEAAYKGMGEAGKPVEDLLNGVWLGHTLHAAVVTVPLGAWTVAAVLDTLEANGHTEYAPGADAALGIGLAGAVGAAATGLTQWYPVKQESVKKVGATHALINATATAAMVASYAARKSGNRGTGRALGWLGFGLSMAGAYLGGTLSYAEHMGSDHAPRKNLPEEFVPVLPASALPENTPTRAQAGEIDLVLVRRGERIHALADTCSHFGGPLSEGEIKGDCITCPWHGSQFDLATGEVVHGPSTYPQPCFQTRVRAGVIEVRAPSDLPQNRQ